MQKPNLPELPFVMYTLANGLEVILLEDHRLPLVAVNIWYHVGPVNERPGRTGFAHLFEHMMFEGSKHVGEKAHFRFLEAVGASEINGTTDFDRTNYFETLPSNQLELALWLESDRMGFLLEGLDEEKLENQKDVVRNERRQNIESAPYGIVREEIFRQLFPEDHPYHASIMGSHADIESAKLSEVRDFFRTYYAPNNASLAIVGDIEPGKTRKLVEKYFGPLPAGKPVQGPRVVTPSITSEKRVTVTDQVELPRVYMAWLTDTILTQGDAELDLIAKILGGGKASRLYKSLVYEKQIAQNVGAQQASMSLGSIFHIEATCKPGVRPEDLETAIREDLELFLENGPDPDEIDSARNIFEAAVIRGMETLGGFGGIADRLNQYNHAVGDPAYLEQDIERYYIATADSLRQTARSRLKRKAGIVIYGVPGKKELADFPKSDSPVPAEPDPAPDPIPDEEWRSVPPSPAPMAPINLPVPRVFQLNNGLHVLFIERHNMPIVSADIIVLSGSERNPPGRPGLASFTAGMLDEGTVRRASLDIAAQKDRLGMSLYTGSIMDMSYIAMWTLKRNLDPAFELASDVLLNPAFAENEFERLRSERLTYILQQKDNPGAIASKIFFDAVYGAKHPYGFMEIGTEMSNRSITREMLVDFYRSGYTPGNSALVVAGDLEENEVHRLAEKFFGGWEGPGQETAAGASGGESNARFIVVDRPEAPQTFLRIGHEGLNRAHPDYIPVDVMNAALGGLFSSRINRNLREKNGYTYGAFSNFVFRRGPGPFVVGTSVKAEATVPAVREILAEIGKIRQEPVTPEELSAAKDSISRSLPGLFETAHDTCSSIGQLFTHTLPEGFYRDLPDRIQSVSAEEILRVAGEHLKPEEAVVVAVGDRKKIEGDLEKAGMGPVEFRDSEGNAI